VPGAALQIGGRIVSEVTLAAGDKGAGAPASGCYPPGVSPGSETLIGDRSGRAGKTRTRTSSRVWVTTSISVADMFRNRLRKGS
jgi:hypothetical protein